MRLAARASRHLGWLLGSAFVQKLLKRRIRAGAAGPSEEEVRQQVEQELRKLKVSDVLLETAVAISSLGFAKLSEEQRDLEQAKLAIESLRVLVPVLEGTVPAEVIRDLNQTVANLQLSYAQAVSAGS